MLSKPRRFLKAVGVARSPLLPNRPVLYPQPLGLLGMLPMPPMNQRRLVRRDALPCRTLRNLAGREGELLLREERRDPELQQDPDPRVLVGEFMMDELPKLLGLVFRRSAAWDRPLSPVSARVFLRYCIGPP